MIHGVRRVWPQLGMHRLPSCFRVVRRSQGVCPDVRSWQVIKPVHDLNSGVCRITLLKMLARSFNVFVQAPISVLRPTRYKKLVVNVTKDGRFL